MAYLRAQGLDCRGVDLSPYEPDDPAIARFIRYGEDACTLPGAERVGIRTLLLLDVLEHLRDPSAFLRRCMQAFPQVSHVVITLPARQELWSNYDAYYGHVRRYDRAAAAALCGESGLDVLRRAYFFHVLYPGLALQRLLRLERGVEFFPVRHPWWHRLRAALLYRDAVWLPGTLPGSSLLVVARPRP